MNTIEKIKQVSNTIRWNEIERYCRQNNFEIKQSKKGYKVRIHNSIWCLHLEHSTSDKLKFGIIRNLRKILVKEKIINLT